MANETPAAAKKETRMQRFGGWLGELAAAILYKGPR
jgi:hypothetical protein